MTTRDSKDWSSHTGHAAFLTGEQLCQSVIILGHQIDDAPLLSDPAPIHQLWSSDASVAMIKQSQSEVPDERCDVITVTDSSRIGFWTTSRALVLPPNHGLPPGYVFDIEQAPTPDSFLESVSQWSGQPVSEWAWFRNGLTRAWFAAASRHPKRFAVKMFPLTSLAPTLERWTVEAPDAGVNARQRHFVYAAAQLRHRYFRDHLYAHATPTMAAKFKLNDERSLATIQATPGLQCKARDPNLISYLYYCEITKL
jgi:hypothetical protein